MEDPSFRVHTDEETGQTIIAGMGELHLEIIVDRMLREFKVEANVGKPQVAYRETITRAVESEGRFIRQTGGRGQYGHCWLRLDPQEPGAGFVFENATVGGTIPKEFIAPIQQGHRGGHARAASWPASRWSTCKVEVFDGSLPRRRLVRDGVQDRRLDGLQGGRRARPARSCSSRSWTSRW